MLLGENAQKGRAIGGLIGIIAGVGAGYGLYSAITTALTTGGSIAGLSMGAGGIISAGSLALPAFISPIGVGLIAAFAAVTVINLAGKAIGRSVGAAKDQAQAKAFMEQMEQSKGHGLAPELEHSKSAPEQTHGKGDDLPSMDLPKANADIAAEKDSYHPADNKKGSHIADELSRREQKTIQGQTSEPTLG